MKRLVFGLLVALLLACGSRKPSQIDDHLLAWLSMARALHHEADIAENQNNIDVAVDRLQALLQSLASIRLNHARDCAGHARAACGAF